MKRGMKLSRAIDGSPVPAALEVLVVPGGGIGSKGHQIGQLRYQCELVKAEQQHTKSATARKRTQLFTKLQAQPFRDPSPTLEPLCKGEHACVQLILSPTSYANLLHGVQFTPIHLGP